MDLKNTSQNDTDRLDNYSPKTVKSNLTELPSDVQERHNKSVLLYPGIDISNNEYVIFGIRKYLIGLFLPIFMSIISVIVLLTLIVLMPDITSASNISNENTKLLYIVLVVMTVLVPLGLYVIYWIYINTQLYLTNESIIAKNQISLFSSNVKLVNLGDVVDISYRQIGILQEMFNYGTIQICTRDNEVPYDFSTVRNPRRRSAILVEVVECYKNGKSLDIALEKFNL